MSARRRRILFTAALAPFAAAGAQGVETVETRIGPQFQSIRIWSPIGERIDQLALPIAVSVPIGPRLVVDVATAYATVEVAPLGHDGAGSTIRGLTDTQVRARWTFGADAVMLSAGVSLPTGESAVAEDEISAAGRIGNDFLAFPISNMGTGLAATAGAAVARPVGSWNLGAGVSASWSAEYDAFDGEATPEVRYRPGSELRLRVGGDRGVAGGRLAMGLTWSGFGADEANGYAYGTGDRWVAQGSYARPIRGADVAVSAWSLARGAGRGLTSTTLPPEHVVGAATSVGVRVRGVRLEPHVEGRLWSRDGEEAGRLAVLGVRTRVDAFGFSFAPSIAQVSGRFAAPDGSNAVLSGARISLAIGHSLGR
ncbi:MAG TPA: hypothetical protein VFZ11_07485 [Gemmatimonadaceae bacterium]